MPGRQLIDPYAVLGVSRDATPLQVARAHRRLAKRHHPDLHEGATDAAERMRNINEAWWVLSNPVRRADYDRLHPSAGMPAHGHWSASTPHPTGVAGVNADVGLVAGDRRRDEPRHGRSVSQTRFPCSGRRPPRPELPTGFRLGLGRRAGGAVIVILLAAAIVVGRLTSELRSPRGEDPAHQERRDHQCHAGEDHRPRRALRRDTVLEREA